jgi:hypothetical protein
VDVIALSILGVCLGHPGITEPAAGYPKSGMELEELDNVFDDYAYDFGWHPWDWEPGLCINCCRDLVPDQDGACENCGWLQNDGGKR